MATPSSLAAPAPAPRKLDDGGYASPYFENYDLTGDAYSLAWRYLGVYIDDDGYRKLLWAAVCRKILIFLGRDSWSSVSQRLHL